MCAAIHLFVPVAGASQINYRFLESLSRTARPAVDLFRVRVLEHLVKACALDSYTLDSRRTLEHEHMTNRRDNIST